MSPRTRPRRTLRAALAGAGALTMTLWVAVGAAMGTPGGHTFHLAAASGPSYAQDAGRFGRVSTSLLDELLGSRVPAPSPTPTQTAEPGGSVTPSPSPSPTPTPSPSPSPTPTPTKRTKLRAVMHAYPQTVRRGDRITYTVTVTNVGRHQSDFVAVLTHEPPHTSFAYCEEGDSACVQPPVPLGASEQHFQLDTGRQLMPGESATIQFQVIVHATAPPDYRRIENHAHAIASNAPQADSNTTVVRLE